MNWQKTMPLRFLADCRLQLAELVGHDRHRQVVLHLVLGHFRHLALNADVASIVPQNAVQITADRVQRITADFSPSYAAVPIGDGWLIVQL